MNNKELKNLINTFLKENKLEKGLLNIEVKKAWFDLMNNGVGNYTTNLFQISNILYDLFTFLIMFSDLVLFVSEINI